MSFANRVDTCCRDVVYLLTNCVLTNESSYNNNALMVTLSRILEMAFVRLVDIFVNMVYLLINSSLANKI